MRHAFHGHAGFTIAVVLAAIVFSGLSLAQTPQAQPFWGVSCAGTASGLDCRVIQNVPMTNSGQASVAVRLPLETKKPVMLILVPAGIYLPAGLSVNFGQEPAKQVVLKSCDSSGCLAEHPITDVEIGAMLKGQALTLSVQDANQQPIKVQVPANGFAAAYAKIK